jgi:hypothetical protein
MQYGGFFKTGIENVLQTIFEMTKLPHCSPLSSALQCGSFFTFTQGV